MNNDFIQALYALEIEKGINANLIIEAVESALKSAYKKNYNTTGEVEVKIDKDSGAIDVFTIKNVVDYIEDATMEITLSEAQKIDNQVAINDKISIPLEIKTFGRIAAQTARQVVALKLREAEKELIFKKYERNKSELVSGLVESIEKDSYIISLEKTKAILPPQGQIPNEFFKIGDRFKAYILDAVSPKKNEPQVILSRNNIEFLKRLFELEVPEIKSGEVEIKSISREAGYRSKVAVFSKEKEIDAIGACIGEEGARVKAIVNELNGEKIDIIPWSETPEDYIAAALSPSDVISVKIVNNDNGVKALVVVPDDQLSLAIGKEGQNARLAAKLTSWKIDIKSFSQSLEAGITTVGNLEEDI